MANPKKDAAGKFVKAEAGTDWTPPDVCPQCGNPGIIIVYERQSVACSQCRKEIPC